MLAPVQSGHTSTASSSVNVFGNSDSASVCPITLEPMRNPVCLLDSGIMYEREAIAEWLRRRGNVCPITRKKLSFTDSRAWGEPLSNSSVGGFSTRPAEVASRPAIRHEAPAPLGLCVKQRHYMRLLDICREDFEESVKWRGYHMGKMISVAGGVGAAVMAGVVVLGGSGVTSAAIAQPLMGLAVGLGWLVACVAVAQVVQARARLASQRRPDMARRISVLNDMEQGFNPRAARAADGRVLDELRRVRGVLVGSLHDLKKHCLWALGSAAIALPVAALGAVALGLIWGNTHNRSSGVRAGGVSYNNYYIFSDPFEPLYMYTDRSSRRLARRVRALEGEETVSVRLKPHWQTTLAGQSLD